MECKELSGYFSEYYDNTLSAFKKERVTKHLLTCKKCALLYKTYREALAYIKTVPDEVLPEEFYRGLEKRLDEAAVPFYLKLKGYLTLKNISVGTLGVIFGLFLGVVLIGPMDVKNSAGKTGQTVSIKDGGSVPAEKEKTAGRMVMRTANVYQASYELGRLVNRFDNAGLEVLPGGQEDPFRSVVHKKYSITVNAGKYEALVKELNALGYLMKLPDKKELAELKKLKVTDQIKLELDITEDGK